MKKYDFLYKHPHSYPQMWGLLVLKALPKLLAIAIAIEIAIAMATTYELKRHSWGRTSWEKVPYFSRSQKLLLLVK